MIVVVYFVVGVVKAILDAVIAIFEMVVGILTFIFGLIFNPKETWNEFVTSLENLWDAIVNIDDTLIAIWNSITESFVRDVINGDAKSRAEWFGYAAGQIALVVVGTKGLDKAAKVGKASQLGRFGENMFGKLPAPVQKVFSKDFWKNAARSFSHRMNINWKNAAITGASGTALAVLGFFGIQKIAPHAIKVIKKFNCIVYEQPADSYLALMKLPDGCGVIGKVKKEGNKVKYTNPAGTELQWFEQRPKDIENKIKSGLNSKNVGTATEAKVADFVSKIKEVQGVGIKITRLDNKKTAGDLDVVTKDEIIEVKRSMKSIENDLEQFDKFTDSNKEQFFNPYNKKVILYIDKPLKNIHPADQKRLDIIQKKGFTIVNSLKELEEVLK